MAEILPINPVDLIVGECYFSHKKKKIYTYKKRGRAKTGQCIYYLLKEGHEVPLPYTGEGVLWLELTPISSE